MLDFVKEINVFEEDVLVLFWLWKILNHKKQNKRFRKNGKIHRGVLETTKKIPLRLEVV